MRVMSRLPVSLAIAEPHPDPNRPGDSPVLKQAVLKPGVNEVDSDLFKAWSDVGGKDFLASSDDVKDGQTDGKVYEMAEDEPETEYGFEPALKRAVEASSAEAAKGSTLTDPGPVKAEDMRTGTSGAAAAPVLTSAAPLKVPATTDAPAAAPATKAQPAAPAQSPTVTKPAN